ncbi:hypothetical protein A499_22332 [Niallia nealsonii AAU1]|nr:hypothetical protein A499_22332 [Niallia nealsonii AAU1]
MIQLNHYKYEPTLHTGKPQCEKVLEYRFAYEGNSYLVEVELDYQNLLLICLFELYDITVKYAGDSGENLYLVFDKMTITENELIKYCNEWIRGIIGIVFEN